MPSVYGIPSSSVPIPGLPALALCYMPPLFTSLPACLVPPSSGSSPVLSSSPVSRLPVYHPPGAACLLLLNMAFCAACAVWLKQAGSSGHSFAWSTTYSHSGPSRGFPSPTSGWLHSLLLIELSGLWFCAGWLFSCPPGSNALQATVYRQQRGLAPKCYLLFLQTPSFYQTHIHAPTVVSTVH